MSDRLITNVYISFKVKEEEVEVKTESGWDVFKDDFMLGSTLKHWDKVDEKKMRKTQQQQQQDSSDSSSDEEWRNVMSL